MSQCRICLVLAFLMTGLGATSSLHAQTPAKTQDSQAQSAQAQPAQASSAQASSAKSPSATSSAQSQDDQNPLHRKLPVWLRRKQEKAYKAELKGPYKKWLNETARWIITDKERRAFLNLSNDEERDAFIENFWRRRNPNPDSPYNTYREKIYERIAYANAHFSDGEPGWMTDRGMIYIKYGPPTSINSHPSGGMYNRTMAEGGGQTSTFPFADWNYRYIAGIGNNVNIEFVDQCMCGNYQMTIDRSAKDALLHVPGAGQTLYEEMGKAKRSQRFNGGLEDIGPGPMSSQNHAKEFDRRQRF